jgi:hypothetical protein
MERSAWTDERLDDMVARTDSQFELLRKEIGDMRAEMRGEFREVRRDLFHGLIAVLGAFVALFAAILAQSL